MTNKIYQQKLKNKKKRGFQEFIFIENFSNNSGSAMTEQLNLSPNNKLVTQAAVEDSLKIVKLHTDKKTSHQLEGFKIKPGAVIKLVSKTNKGSVVISLENKLIGIGAEVAHKIVASPAT